MKYKNLRILVLLLITLSCCSRKKDTQNSSKDLHDNVIEYDSSADYELLEKDEYVPYIKYDTVRYGGNFAEYLEFGLLEFDTKKDIKPWLDSLHRQFGKSVEKGADSLNKEYLWEDINYWGLAHASVTCMVSYESKPHRFNVNLIVLDKNKQLIDDTLLLNKEIRRINSLVFSRGQKLFEEDLSETISIGKNRYLSFWNDFKPINFDSVMLNIAKKKVQIVDWTSINVKCIVNEEGKITVWKLEKDGKMTKIDSLVLKSLDAYKNQFRFEPIIVKQKIKFRAKFSFFDVLTDSLNRKHLIENIDEFLKVFPDSSKINYDVFVNRNQNMGKYRKVTIVYDGKHLMMFHEIKNHWVKVYDIVNSTAGSFSEMEITDLNGDGYNDVTVSSFPNMNGNRWSDVYMYTPDNDSFLFAEESIYLGGYYDDYIKNVKKGYLITQYTGSWYMPVTTTVYKWVDYRLEPQVVLGRELLFRDMNREDMTIFFVYRRVNNKLKLVKQININASNYYDKEADKLEKQIIKQYLD